MRIEVTDITYDKFGQRTDFITFSEDVAGRSPKYIEGVIDDINTNTLPFMLNYEFAVIIPSKINDMDF